VNSVPLANGKMSFNRVCREWRCKYEGDKSTSESLSAISDVVDEVRGMGGMVKEGERGRDGEGRRRRERDGEGRRRREREGWYDKETEEKRTAFNPLPLIFIPPSSPKPSSSPRSRVSPPMLLLIVSSAVHAWTSSSW
jgi:hypothetical protein